MIVQTVHQQHPIFKLSNRPVYCEPILNHFISFGLTNQALEIVDLNKLKSQILQTGHTKRINMIRAYQDNILLTCSNDGGVKLWDLRANYSNISTLKRGYQIYSVAMDDTMIITGSISRVTFWDPKTNKQTKSYQESFDGDVTDLALKDHKIYGCGTDGIVACFDPLVELEEDAAQWTHRIGYPAQSLKLHDSYVALTTTDHVLIALNQQIEVKKIEINSADQPRHLLWSHLFKQQFDYIVWNINESRIERWHQKEILDVAININDIDFVQVVKERVIGVSGQGGLLDLKFEKNNQKVKDIQIDEGEGQQQLIKVKYNKINKKKMFNPF